MITVRDVVREVCREFGAPRSMSKVLSCTRGTPEVARLRRYAMSLYRHLPGQTFSSTGRAFDRDRTTVRHACERVGKELFTSPAARQRYSRMSEAIRAKVVT